MISLMKIGVPIQLWLKVRKGTDVEFTSFCVLLGIACVLTKFVILFFEWFAQIWLNFIKRLGLLHRQIILAELRVIIASFICLWRVVKQAFCLGGKDVLDGMLGVEGLSEVRVIIVMVLSFFLLFGLSKGDEMGVFGD